MIEEQNLETTSGENSLLKAVEAGRNENFERIGADSEPGSALDGKSDKTKNGEKPAVIMPFPIPAEEITVCVKNFKKKPFYDFFKRAADFIICLLALIILLPAFLIIGIIIKCSSRGHVIYTQERLGLNGKKIKVPKFRTMHENAEKDGAQWSEGDDDPRIYPFGRFLRKSRLDELPQLWCCVIGTMSLVGPRPERECFAVEFEKYIHGFSERLKVKPGLTGLAQVNGGYYLKPEQKIIYDVEYIENRSLGLDIKIAFKTVGIIFNHDGAK